MEDRRTASFEEKSVRLTLTGLLVTFGLYFAGATWLLLRGVRTLIAFAPLLVAVVVVLVAILVIGHVVAALQETPEAADERDRIIEWRAESATAWVMGFAAIAAVVGMLLAVNPVWIANGLILALVVAETAKYGLQLRFYRRGL